MRPQSKNYMVAPVLGSTHNLSNGDWNEAMGRGFSRHPKVVPRMSEMVELYTPDGTRVMGSVRDKSFPYNDERKMVAMSQKCQALYQQRKHCQSSGRRPFIKSGLVDSVDLEGLAKIIKETVKAKMTVAFAKQEMKQKREEMKQMPARASCAPPKHVCGPSTSVPCFTVTKEFKEKIVLAKKDAICMTCDPLSKSIKIAIDQLEAHMRLLSQQETHAALNADLAHHNHTEYQHFVERLEQENMKAINKSSLVWERELSWH